MCHFKRFLSFIILTFWISSSAFGAIYLDTKKYHLLDVEEISTDLYKIADHRTGFSNKYEDDWTKGFAFNLGLRGLYNFVFFDARVETFGTSSQLREAGMWWRTGFNLTDQIQVYYSHHSSHMLDDEHPENTPFVIQNYYGVRLIFYKK